MRFRFFDQANAGETAEREGFLKRMDEWWKAFAAEASNIDAHFTEGIEFDVPTFMSRHLGAVDDRLSWEFGPPLAGGRHRLVITPESDRFLRPMLDELLRRAPENTGFEFLPFRPALAAGRAASIVTGRTGVVLDDGWRAYLAPTGDFGIDMTFKPSTRAGDAASNAAVVVAESLLGEERLETFIDAIEVTESPSGPIAHPFDALTAEVEALLERQREQLLPAPVGECTSMLKGHILRLEPEPADDFARQDDLFVAKTVLLPMWRRAHSRSPFMSRRFSRSAETFCYLKTDGGQGLAPAGFEDKSAIEDALEAVLTKYGLGALVGGGTGLRYSYVDLALVDVERAIPLIREALRGGRLPKRSWLLFFDSELAAEWVGIWDDSPPPPMIRE